MNRYATHILEDIQSCVIEGLVTNDEQMNVVPVLASSVPTLANGGVTMRADGGMDVTWKLRPGVKWHDGHPHTSADVKFTVDAINKGDWKPESTDGFDRIASVDTPDSLTAVVHYKEVYAPYQMQFLRGTLPKHVLEGPRHRQGQRLQPHAARHRPVSRRRMEDRRIHPARESEGLLARSGVSEDQPDSVSLRRQHDDAHQPAQGGRSARGGARAVGQGARAQDRPGDSSQSGARQRLRARHAEREALSRRSPTCACDARSPTRSIAS